jgi:hypothetical protein
MSFEEEKMRKLPFRPFFSAVVFVAMLLVLTTIAPTAIAAPAEDGRQPDFPDGCQLVTQTDPLPPAWSFDYCCKRLDAGCQEKASASCRLAFEGCVWTVLNVPAAVQSVFEADYRNRKRPLTALAPEVIPYDVFFDGLEISFGPQTFFPLELPQSAAPKPPGE